MSPTLGEKLRQARESRGMTISNVSEQTRIASHHLVAIEEDNYGGLPGGIFNKGFIRSFAKCVGVNEDEALSDYAALTSSASSTEKSAEELYSPAVYSDAGGINPKVSTIVVAAVVVLITVVGLGAFVYYLFEDGEPPAEQAARVEQTTTPTPAPIESPAPTPATSGISVEVTAAEELIQFMSEVDGVKRQVNLPPNETEKLEAESALKLRIYRTLVPLVRMTLNGKEISLQKPRGSVLEISIDKENVSRIYDAGAYSGGEETAAVTPSNSATPAVASASRVSETSNPAGATAPRPAVNRPRANANRPPANRPRTAANAATSVRN